MVNDYNIRSDIITSSILNYLIRLEVGRWYEINSIPIIDPTKYPKEEVIVYLKLIEKVLDYEYGENDPPISEEIMREIETAGLAIYVDENNDRFIITMSEVFQSLSDLHRILVYMDLYQSKHLTGFEDPPPVPIPERLKTENFNKYLDVYIYEEEPGLYDYTALGLDEIVELNKILANIRLYCKNPTRILRNLYVKTGSCAIISPEEYP
ncbi:MAG: hypothetical protein ACTSQP_08215 [Promethearchaeota archaeon]